MTYRIRHDFPLDQQHEGTTIGNGRLGLSVWGRDRLVRISIGVSGLWDHRGGMSWDGRQNYRALRAALARSDAEAIRAMFAPDGGEGVVPSRPSHIPVGRLELTLPGPARSVTLELESGLIEVVWCGGRLVVALSPADKGCFGFRVTPEAELVLRPAYELSGELRQLGFPPPRRDDDGFEQAMPADAPFQVRFRRRGDEVLCRFAQGDEPVTFPGSLTSVIRESRAYWRNFAAAVPQVSTPNPLLDELFRVGLCKFEAMTMADGVPAGLQGPWVEDDRRPPWSNDFHFNINVQMCYWPAYCSGRWANLLPLFRMILGWRERLRRNAEGFVGIPDGCLLPHAVDDRGVCMGSFWTGCIDLACGAWMAQLMFDYVRYSGDSDLLREGAFDFMKGVFNVYQSQLEERDGRLTLPVGVSPEYRGGELDAWGADASFQLAAVHRLAADLSAAAELLGEPPDPRWRELREKLPPVTLLEVDGRPEIALWRGEIPAESHRHHSHLGAIVPFNIIQADDPAWAEVIDASRRRWIALGIGRWAGWSMPWAVMLHNRFGHRQMTEELIELWGKYYRNRGGGTLHDPWIQGLALTFLRDPGVMQMDAGMGMVAAIADLFAYETGGVIHALHGVPGTWSAFEVRGLWLPGGFRLAARRESGRDTVELTATRGGALKLELHGEFYEGTPAPGETVRLTVPARTA